MKDLIIILFSFSNILIAQPGKTDSNKIKYEIGISTESSILLSTRQVVDTKKEESYLDAYPLSLFLHGTLFLKEDTGVEIKPGWIFGGEPFTSIEFGFYLMHYAFEHKYFGKIGIIIHKNLSVGHGTFSSTDESVFLAGIVLGFKPTPKFSFSLGYYNPFSKYLYFSDWDDINNEFFDVYLDHLIRFGFEINF